MLNTVDPTGAAGTAAGSGRAVAALVALIIAAGFGLRVANLDGPAFNVDEVLHAFAARELLDGKPPALPSGIEYTRALPYTRLVALAGRFGGVDEWTTRLPSVVFGCLTVGLLFVMTRRWYSTAAGLLAAAIAAVDPMQIAFSREGRMYTMFQFFFLLMVFTFFEGIETGPGRRERRRLPARVREICDAHEIRPLLLVAAAVALLLARGVHDLTLIAVAGPAAYVVIMAALATAAGRTLAISRAKYVGLAVVVLAVGLAYAYSHQLAARYASVAGYAPAWAINNTRWTYYVQALTDGYPGMLQALLLCAGVGVMRNARATLYVLVCLGVPLLIHSVLFTWKHERYILHLVPLMFVLFSVGVCAVVPRLYRSLASWAAGPLSPSAARLAAGGLTAASVGFLLILMPWFRGGLAVHRVNEGSVSGTYHQDWRSAARFVSEHAGPSDVVIASAPALARYYGLGASLHYLANDSTDVHLSTDLRDTEGRVVDYIAGAPLILDLEALEHVISSHPSGWVVSERFRFDGSRPLPSDMRELITARARREPVPGSDSMVVYRW